MLPCRFNGVVSDSCAVETSAGSRPASGGVAAVEVLPISNLVSVCGLSFCLSCIWFCQFGFVVVFLAGGQEGVLPVFCMLHKLHFAFEKITIDPFQRAFTWGKTKVSSCLRHQGIS